MSADVLREAAALMRTRAESATPGPWHCATFAGTPTVRGNGNRNHVSSIESQAPTRDAEHIASWHPAVALAVAAWLDAQASLIETSGDFFDEDGCDAASLAVAHAYLGTTP